MGGLKDVVAKPVCVFGMPLPEPLPDRDLGIAAAEEAAGIYDVVAGKGKFEDRARVVLGTDLLLVHVVAFRLRRQQAGGHRPIVLPVHR